jgi:Rrf2 family protein
VAIENAQLYEEVRDRAQRLEAIRGITTAIIAGEGSVTGEVIRTGKAVVLADASADERVVQPIVRAQVGPTMFVPLAVRGTILGTLTVANAKGGPLLREAAIPLVETFAEQAAVAIEYGRLQGELQRLALLEDRERIAKELHDGAIQALFAVGMGLQGSAALAASEELRGRLQDAVEEVDRVMRDLRTYIFGLRPAELTGRAADVIQLAREALSNVSRHAQAVTCRGRCTGTSAAASWRSTTTATALTRAGRPAPARACAACASGPRASAAGSRSTAPPARAPGSGDHPTLSGLAARYPHGVDLALTRRGDYAVRAALCLARRGGEGGYVKMREVAATMALPASYTPQVLRLLAEAGLAEARAGRDGGYRLTRPPDEIALLEVVEAAEGVFRLERCILRGGPCHWEQACAVHAAWSAAVQACRDSLARTTLADLVGADAKLEADGGFSLRGFPPA